MKPSALYQQHHEVEAPRIDARVFRQGWRVRTRLDRLLVEGAISRAAWQAAHDLRTWVETTARIGGSSLLCIGSGVHDPDGAMLGRLGALARLRDLGDELHAERIAIVTAVAVEDVTWRELGRRLGIDHKTARLRAIVALGELEKHARRWPQRGAWGGRGEAAHDQASEPAAAPTGKKRGSALADCDCASS